MHACVPLLGLCAPARIGSAHQPQKFAKDDAARWSAQALPAKYSTENNTDTLRKNLWRKQRDGGFDFAKN
jgi:hypothetical protein